MNLVLLPVTAGGFPDWLSDDRRAALIALNRSILLSEGLKRRSTYKWDDHLTLELWASIPCFSRRLNNRLIIFDQSGNVIVPSHFDHLAPLGIYHREKSLERYAPKISSFRSTDRIVDLATV